MEATASRVYLSLEEEFDGACWRYPSLQLQLAKTVFVRDKHFPDHETNCQEKVDSNRPEGVHPDRWLVGLGREGSGTGVTTSATKQR